MTLDQIFQALRDDIAGGSIDLVTAATGDLASMATALDLLQLKTHFLVANAVLTQPVNQVLLRGTARYGLPGAEAAGNHVVDVGVALAATVEGGNAVFTLTLFLPPQAWTFSDTFAGLPDSQQIAQDGQTVELAPSFLIGLPLRDAALAARSAPGATATLEGSLPQAGVFSQAAYAGLFPGRWPLAARGAVVLPATYDASPDLDLMAIVNGSTLPFGDATLFELGFELSVQTGFDLDDYGYSAVSNLNLTGKVQFDPEHSLRLVLAILTVQTTWRLLVEADPDTIRIGDQIENVAALLGLSVAELISPETLDTFNAFYLASIEIWLPAYQGSLLDSLGAAAFDVSNIGVTLKSDRVWNPPIPFVRVIDTGMRWDIGWAPGPNNQPEMFSFGSVFGGINIGVSDAEVAVRPSARELPLLSAPHPLMSDVRMPVTSALAAGDGEGDDPPILADSFTVDLVGFIPSFVIEGRLRSNQEIPIGYAFNQFFGNPGPPTKDQMRITAFAFMADPYRLTFRAEAVVTMNWSIPFTNSVSLDLIELRFNIDVRQSAVGGSIAGTLQLTGGGSGDAQPQFTVSATYVPSTRASEWKFRGFLNQNAPLELVTLVANLLTDDPPDNLPALNVERMSIEFASSSQAYKVEGSILARWQFSPFGTPLTISARAEAAISRPNSSTAPSGYVAGSFQINRIGLYASRDIGVEFPTYTFRVLFGDNYLTAQTAWIGEGDARHQIVTLQLSSITLGEILEYLVNLAAPTLGYKLTPPWDLLNQIDLSRFALTIDPTEQTIALTYAVTVDLTIFRVDKIGVKYSRKQGEGSVNLILEGAALGQEYTGDDALDWDVINDNPPDLVPASTAVIDLRYLAFGQHVKINDIDNLNTVRAVLLQMERAMQPVATDQSPIGQPGANGVSFDAGSQWLIGLDIGIAGMLDLGLIFNDPRLYGLSISMGGPDAGSLAGLYFEILYKKITDSLGMFRVELQLPEAFRHLEFGEVSITLGVVVVEVYTNGNFKVDLGFPHERDFSRSFSVEVFPFIGRGGIYFGLLDGNSSSRVPAISNGFFAPVIELGVGIAVGVGKDFSVGVLSAGAFIELEVIFEGVFARFLPSNSGEDSALYYWVRGMAGLHGKIYGTVDFVVIKVNVTLEASATVTLTLEAHQPTLVALNVDVTARASVKILFIRVHFSFNVTVSFDFTLGSKSTTPWILAGTGGGGQGTGLAAARGAPMVPGASASLYRLSRGRRDVRIALLRSAHLRQLHAANLIASPATPRSLLMGKAVDRRGRTGTRMTVEAEASETLNWDPAFAVFSDSPRTIPLILLPAFACDNIALSWSTPPVESTAVYKIVLQLWAATGTVIDPDSIAESYRRDTSTSAHAGDVSEMPAAELVEAFLRWAIYAVTNPAGGTAAADVTAGQLAHLADEMAAGDAATRTAFTFTTLSAFLDTNVRFSVSGQPTVLPTELSAMPVAMPPVFRFEWSGDVAGSVDLAAFNPIGPDYIADVAAYQQAFTPTAAQSAVPPDGAADTVSFASHMFSDWSLMLTRAAVDEAQKQLARWELRPDAATSLAALAAGFSKAQVQYAVREGDTVNSVALALGATAEELLYLNDDLDAQLRTTPAGSEITILLGVAPEVIALDNSGRDLVPGQYAVDHITYQVRDGDTLAGIATAFGLAGATSLLSDPTLAANPALLRADASFTTPATHYTAPAGFGALQAAAFFFARFQDTRALADRQCYVDLILYWNAQVLRDQQPGDALAPGLALKLPVALGNLTEPAEANYTTQIGDTVTAIAAVADLTQNQGSGPAVAIPGWATYRDAMVTAFTQGSGGAAAPALVPSVVTILPGESLDHLARRSYIFGGQELPDVAGLIGWIASAPDLLAVHAALGIDGFTLDTTVYPSFGAVSQGLGLDIAALAHQLAGATLVPVIAEDDDAWIVTDVPVVAVDTLVSLVLTGKGFTDITAQSSRQLMSGLRLPGPVSEGDGPARATGPMTAMASLSGQQLTGPPPGTATTPSITITATLDSGFDWIGLVDSIVAEEGETRVALEARAPAALSGNRRLAQSPDAEPMAGTILQLDAVDQLDFAYTPADLNGLYPAASLTVVPFSGPEALPLSVEVPVTYGLSNRIELQVTAPLAIPAEGVTPKTGNPSLWPFPAAVQALALAGAPTGYDLVRSAPQGVPGGEDETLLSSSYGTLFSVKIKTLPGSRTLYQLLGTDDVQRQTLLHLWQYLVSNTTPPPTLSLFVSPDPAAANIQGLAQVALDASLSTIVKTNLSTETVPGLADVHPLFRAQAVAPRDTAPVYAAALADIPGFLKLLWEGVSVGGTGYYLTLRDPDGGGLPPTIFTTDGEAVIQFLAIVGAQQGSAPLGRPLLPLNTCALIGPGLDASASTVYLEAADGSDMKRIAIVPPGNAGTRMVIPMAPKIPVTSEDRAQQLYSIATYDVGQESATFYADRPGMPILPDAKDDPALTATARRRLARQARARSEAYAEAEPTRWSYSQVFPIAQMGPASSAPAVNGLPLPGADPYRGINSGTAPVLADLAIGFVDIFGNASAPDQAKAITLPVGYTDVLVGFDSWPGLATGYGLAAGATAGTVAIGVTFATQAGTLMPSLSGPAESAVLAAENQAAIYETVYYQLSQPLLALTFTSTLYSETSGAGIGHPKPVDLSAQLPALWRVAAANLLYARAVAALDPERPLAAAAQTIGALAQIYGLGTDVLAAGQAQARAYDILGGQALTIPAQVPFAENQTANAIRAVVRPGWPQPASGAAMLAMPQNADHLPLRPGTLLAIPDRPITVPSGDPVPSLGAIAALAGSTAPLLAEDNAAATDILAGGVTVVFDALTVTTVAPGVAGVRSFDDMVAGFAAQGVIVFVGDVGAQLADQTDTLVAGSAMVAKRYLVPLPTEQAPFETLASNGSGTSVADLASHNAATPNVFDTGALVYLGDFPGSPAAQASATTTLVEFCYQYGTTPAQLFAALAAQNPPPSLPMGVALTIPGMLALPQDPGAVRMPCPVRASDTLSAIAGRFAYANGRLDQLGLDNEAMPGLFAANQTVTVSVDGSDYDTVTQAGDGIGSVLARLQAKSSAIELPALMAAIGPQTGLLAEGALLSCPPAVMPDPAGNGALTPNQAAAAFGTDATAFLAANAALKGLLKPGVTVNGPGPTPFTAETAPIDTVTALLARLAAAGAQIDVAQLASINGDIPFLAAGALALLPPAPLTIAVSVPAAAGPFADPVMPLQVSLTLARPETRIDPAFVLEGAASAVQSFTTRIGSPVSSSGAGGGQGVDQDSFGTLLAQLFPTLRLVTGRVAGKPDELWFLPFDASGLAALTVEGVFDPPSGQGDKWPRYFALRPLYASLVSLQAIQLPALNPDGTLNRDTPLSDLIGLDVEPIAQRFLQDMEQLLSAQYAGALYADAQARAALLSVIASKQKLASAVANGIAPVFQQADPGLVPATYAAAAELRQALLLSLTQGYAVSTILQYVSTCSSAWIGGDAAPARLLGRAIGGPDDAVSSGLQYAITAAKTRLDAASDYVNFLLTLNDPAHAEQIALALQYAFSNLEFDINVIPVATGMSYDASDWLAFTPLLNPAAMPPGIVTKLGDVTVPIPNRAFPQVPTLRGQTVGSDPVAVLAGAAKWTYALRYSHEHASQDEVHLDIRFNQQPEGLMRMAVVSDALAGALISYDAVATGLWDLLGYYADPAKGDAQTAAAAAASFATLAATVADTWVAHWPDLEQRRLAVAPVADAVPPGLSPAMFGFDVDLDYLTVDGGVLVTDVRVACGSGGPGPSGQWPELIFRTVDGLPVPTTRSEISSTQSRYTLEHPAPAGSYADIALEWHGIAMASYQNATASLMVTRNGHLSEDFATNPDFVFSTDLVDASSTVTPINNESTRFDITGLGTDLGSALTAAFQALFGDTAYLGQPVTLALSYGFELLANPDPDAEPLVSYLPIALYPDQELAATTGATIQSAVEAWILNQGPNPDGGEIVVSLSLYSQIQNREKLTLLTVERLVYKLASSD
ncbi:hypothetical protein [Sphingomonas gei]|nr:hypothetical protein [Sphingomonas gei]